MFNYWFLLIPLLTAIAGMICVRLPFLLLFWPMKPFSIFGKKVQGVVPAMQADLATQAGVIASRQLPLDALENKISDPSNFDKIRPMIEVHIDDFLRNKLKEQMPMISMFIGDKTIVSLKTVFINEIADLFPKIMGQFAGNLKSEFDVSRLVSEKVRQLDLPHLKEAFEAKTKRPLRMLAGLGFGIGLLIGLLQLLVIYLAAGQS